MEEEVKRDSLLGDTSSEAALDAFDITESYEWGGLPNTSLLRLLLRRNSKAHLAAKALKESNPQDLSTAAPQKLTQTEETTISSSPKDHLDLTQKVNAFGEQCNPIASVPHKRGHPFGTTKSTPVDNTPCNPVGRPRKKTINAQPSTQLNKQVNSNPVTEPRVESQDEYERVSASQQYTSQPVFHEPPFPEVYHDVEEHSHTGVPS